MDTVGVMEEEIERIRRMEYVGSHHHDRSVDFLMASVLRVPEFWSSSWGRVDRTERQATRDRRKFDPRTRDVITWVDVPYVHRAFLSSAQGAHRTNLGG